MALRSNRKVDAVPNSSSMTDLVFLLLIFFVVLSLFVNTQQMKVDLPTTQSPQAASSGQPPVTISIDKELRYYINKKLIPAQELEAALLRVLMPAEEKSAIALYVDKTVPTQELIATLGIIKKHRWKVAVSTQQK